MKITSVDDESMLFSMDIRFRQEWKDDRLKYATSNALKYITLDDDEYIWTPDLFFNEYKAYAHDTTRPNILLRIYADGSVLLSKRYSLVVYCPMDFSKFPFDHQKCALSISSFAWKENDLILAWNYEDPIHFAERVDSMLPFFKLRNYNTTAGDKETQTGIYEYLQLEMVFSRDLNQNLIRMFVPITMFAVVAYGVFWIDVKQFCARLLLGFLSLFAARSSIDSINEDTPAVSYITAIDVFAEISMTFIFAAVIETIFVHFLENRRRESEGTKTNIINDEEDAAVSKDLRSKLKQAKKWMIDNSTNKVDAVFKILYPLLYVTFQIIFWSVCLSYTY
ncbi:PREDICTED: glutamate-gated chloride channel-like [Nicrophorus vespilloides]|uniref:Glutamate-gated chloride channel-like n=1 Tax=Nicrophorus vespilloides TaxID=110193 RepID=A0ABM1M416_NICVS|nr:PREDICTED: glutamate-gated chloride channel-like [Nicrophorus vespilloides]